MNKIGFQKNSPPPPSKPKPRTKRAQQTNHVKREVLQDPGPRRQSARLKRPAEDNAESPEEKRARLVRSPPSTLLLTLNLPLFLKSTSRRNRDERLRTNVFKSKSVKGRQGNLVIKTSSSILSSSLRAPEAGTMVMRRTDRRTTDRRTTDRRTSGI